MNDDEFDEHVVTSVATMPEFAQFMIEHHPEYFDYIESRYGKNAETPRAWHGYAQGTMQR